MNKKPPHAPVIYWFRQDLRLADLPGLRAAAGSGLPVLACYVLDDDTPGSRAHGGASRWWLHHSLAALQHQIEARGGHLLLLHGRSDAALPELASRYGARAVYASRRHEPWARDEERRLEKQLGSAGISLRTFPGALLFEPDDIRTGGGEPYRVFTPFWKACRRTLPPGAPLALPRSVQFVESAGDGLPLEQLALTPRRPDWAAHWAGLWRPGAEGAKQALQRFLRDALADYAEGRDHPSRAATSRLSPHLHFGEISPRQVWHAVHTHCDGHPALDAQRDKFLAELGWREFNHHLLHHFPQLPGHGFNPTFDNFPWLGNEAAFRAWCRGETGYPIVDAGMRELWQTGYMHNRVRMITASFLTKHLLVDWRRGEAWFHDTLVDADLANNVCGWQWVAGCGADAAPYFRIFNPTLQGRKFDAGGNYVRRWIPELARLPDRYLHEPAAAPAAALAEAGVTLGKTYPAPIVDHRDAREAALAAYASLRGR